MVNHKHMHTLGHATAIYLHMYMQWPCPSTMLLLNDALLCWLLWDRDSRLACGTLVGLHIADFTEHLVMTNWQSETGTAFQTVQTFAGRLLQHNLSYHRRTN